MRSFTTAELNKQVGEVTNAAQQAPVVITRHKKPRFVLMSMQFYEELQGRGDSRHAYAAGETPPDLAQLILAELDRQSGAGEQE